jgi:hypothetical protein
VEEAAGRADLRGTFYVWPVQRPESFAGGGRSVVPASRRSCAYGSRTIFTMHFPDVPPNRA